MTHSLIIGWNTVRELIRDKLFCNLVFFALLLIFSSWALSRLTIAEPQRVVVNVGLSSMNFFGLAIAVMIGITLVSRELDRRTIYVLVTKPVSRTSVLVGKFIGLCVTLFINMLMMVVGLLVVLWLAQIPLTPAIAQSLGAMYMELAITTAVALLFSTFTTSALSGMFTLAAYVIGESVTDLRLLGEKLGGGMGMLLTGSSYMVPNFELFNLKGRALYQETLAAEDYFLLMLYGIVYIICLLVLGSTIFHRRDLA